MTSKTLRITVETNGARRNTKELNSELKKLNSQGNSAAKSVNTVSKSLVGMGSVIAGVGFGALVNDIARTAGVLESLNFRLGAVSQDLAGDLNYLGEASRRLSTDYLTMAGSYQKLLVLQDSGLITLQQARDLTEGFSGAQRALGASTVQLDQSLYGLTQGLSSSVILMEEFRQITEPLPGLINLVEKENELAAGSLRRMVLAGELTGQTFIKLVTPALQKFESTAEAMGDTFDSTVTKMNNSYTQLKGELGKEVNTALIPVMQSMTESMEYFTENAEDLKDVIGGVVLAGAALFSAQQINRAKIHGAAVLGNVVNLKAHSAAIAENAIREKASAAAKLNSAKSIQSKTFALKAELTAQLAAAKTDQSRLALSGQLIAANNAYTVSKKAVTAAEVAHGAAIGRTAVAMRGATVAATAYAVAGRAASSAFALIGGPAGAVTLAAAGVYALWSANQDYRKGADEAVKSTHDQIKALNELGESALGSANKQLEALQVQLATLKSKNKAVEGGLGDIITFGLLNYSEEIRDTEAAIESLSKGIEDAVDRIPSGLERAARDNADMFARMKGEAKSFADKFTLDDPLQDLEEMKKRIEYLNSQGSFKSANDYKTALAGVNAEIAKVNADKIKAVQDELKAATEKADEARSVLGRLFPDTAQAREYTAEIALLKSQLGGSFDSELLAGISEIESKLKDLKSNTTTFDLLGRSFTTAKDKAEPLKSLLTNLFPDSTAEAKYKTELQLLNDEMAKAPENVGLYETAIYNLKSAFENSGVSGQFRSLRQEIELAASSKPTNTSNQNINANNAIDNTETNLIAEEEAKYQARQQIIQSYALKDAEAAAQARTLELEAKTLHENAITDIQRQAIEQRIALEQAANQRKIQDAATVGTGLISLLKTANDAGNTESKKSFERNKKLSIAQAVLSGGVAVANAWTAQPWYIAAAQAAIAFRNTQKVIQGIKSTTYSGGGSAGAPSSGNATGSAPTSTAETVNNNASAGSEQNVTVNYYASDLIDTDKYDIFNAKSIARNFEKETLGYDSSNQIEITA